jgi:hypothetical protein
MDEIYQDPNSMAVWVADEGTKDCSAQDQEVHEPTPDIMDCDSCGQTIAWDFSEKYCSKCIAEEQSENRASSQDYWITTSGY